MIDKNELIKITSESANKKLSAVEIVNIILAQAANEAKLGFSSMHYNVSQLDDLAVNKIINTLKNHHSLDVKRNSSAIRIAWGSLNERAGNSPDKTGAQLCLDNISSRFQSSTLYYMLLGIFTISFLGILLKGISYIYYR